MPLKIKVPVKIIHKRYKNGWFFDHFYVTIKPLDILEETPKEVEVYAGIYHDLNVGDEILLSFINDNGRISLYRPY